MAPFCSDLISNDQRRRSAGANFGSGAPIAREKRAATRGVELFCGTGLSRASAAAEFRQLGDGRLRRDRERLQTRREARRYRRGNRRIRSTIATVERRG